jgi:two-component system LytT family response regulator
MRIFERKTDLRMLRTIIIDDEAHMRQSLEKMIRTVCGHVKIVATADGVKTGIAAIKKYHPDLIFLDIKMDDGTGFDLLKQLAPVEFRVIFVTAFDEFAIKAFKFSAIDFLLKPVDADELKAATEKAEQLKWQDFKTQLDNLNESMSSTDKANKKIVLRTSESIHLVKVLDICYCASDGNYTLVYLLNGTRIMVSNTLKEYDDMLKDFGFFRTHKSYLINMRHVVRFEKAEGGKIILCNDSEIPVASRKREELLELFNRLND